VEALYQTAPIRVGVDVLGPLRQVAFHRRGLDKLDMNECVQQQRDLLLNTSKPCATTALIVQRVRSVILPACAMRLMDFYLFSLYRLIWSLKCVIPMQSLTSSIRSTRN
jgi:hypothetical protein